MPLQKFTQGLATLGEFFWGIKKAFSFEKALMLVIPKGFEPLTHRLEICCSIQLSYETMLKKKAATVEDKS